MQKPRNARDLSHPLFELRLDTTLTEDEVAYLTLHVARVTDQTNQNRSSDIPDHPQLAHMGQ